MLSKNTKNKSISSDNKADDKLFITRKRKKYKFAKYDELDNTYQFDDWNNDTFANLKGDDQDRRVIVEVGAGTGLFSVELAKRHPENIYIAIDIKSDRLYTGAKLANELGLKNIVFIRSDIWRLKELFNENSISEIWITFPDPYANEDQTKLKKSDAKHRLTHPRFLDLYKTILTDDGSAKLNFKTDNKPLFEWSKEQIEQSGWRINEVTNDLHESNLGEDYKIKTSYEERFTAEGLVIHLLTAKIE